MTQRLESISEVEDGMPESDITKITDPLIGFGSAEEMMSLAKSASHYLYSDIEPVERVEKINSLLSKLRLALDTETSNHADLMIDSNDLKLSQQKDKSAQSLDLRLGLDSTLLQQAKPPSSSETKDLDLETKMAKLAFLLGQSEERVQALSIIMLHLCSGLQHAQGIATQ